MAESITEAVKNALKVGEQDDRQAYMKQQRAGRLKKYQQNLKRLSK